MKNLLLVFSLVAVLVSMPATATETSKKEVKEVVLSVGMHCQNCADKVIKQLSYTKGVKGVEADHAKNLVTVKYRTDKTTPEKLIASLKEIDFVATVQAKACCSKTEVKSECASTCCDKSKTKK